jgi:hypothetical protein
LTQISEYWGNVTKCGGNLKFSTLGEASCLCGCQSVYQTLGLFRSCAQLGWKFAQLQQGGEGHKAYGMIIWFCTSMVGC